MFCLAQQVDGTQFAVDAVIGNDQRFGGARKQIDPDAAIQLAFGLGHEHISRPNQHVHGRHAGGAYGHGHHGLHTAQHQDFIGARHVHGRDNGWVRLALIRRRRGHDAFYAGNFCGQYAHVGRSQQGVFPARDITAHRIYRDVLVAQHYAGIGLDFHILHRVALDPRKIADLFLCERDVVDFTGGQLLARRLDLVARQAEILGIPIVELAAVFANGIVALLFDVADDAFDRGTHLGVVVGFDLGRAAAFQVSDHDEGALLRQWMMERRGSTVRALHAYANKGKPLVSRAAITPA
ncbi:hypothetical protein D9M72_163900 [compost metagenome]